MMSKVTSSGCGTPRVNFSIAVKMAACNPSTPAAALRATSSCNRSIPNCSPSGFTASLRPSVNNTRVSPGLRLEEQVSNSTSGNRPSGRVPAGKANWAWPSWTKMGGRWPALINSSLPALSRRPKKSVAYRGASVGTNETIDLSEYARRLLPGGHGREGPLKDGAQQRCTHAFAADISHDKGGAVGAELHQIKIVAPHRQSRAIDACDL